MKDEDKQIKKEAYKEAMREFLEEQKKATYETLGKWFANGFSALVVGGLLWLILKANGWNHS